MTHSHGFPVLPALLQKSNRGSMALKLTLARGLLEDEQKEKDQSVLTLLTMTNQGAISTQSSIQKVM